MIAVLERPDVLDGIPRVITSEAQNERYISALREMERHGNLAGAENNLAEVLTLLIEAHEEEHCTIRSASLVRC